MTVFGQVSHSSSSLTLRVISQLDNYAIDESLGFRDVNLIFAESTESNVNRLCGLSPIPLPSNQCDCSNSEYFNMDTSACQFCDPSCRSCFGSTAEECYDCQMGYSFVNSECIKCDESCADCSGPNADQCTDCSVGMSLFNNEVCVTDCASTSVSGTVLVCDQPCLTAGQSFFYKNQTCSEDCNSPFIIETLESGALVCRNPCPGGFLYWDGTCNSLCPFPLKKGTTDDGLSLCVYNCKPEEFLYWDGSCKSVCNGSFVSSAYKNRKFCQHPCLEPTDFIYWNGTCKSSCPFPLHSSNDGKARYCDFPCTEGQLLSQDGKTCLDSCNLPFRIREEDGINYCKFPCDSSEYLYWDETCRNSCPSPYKASSGGPGIQFCIYLCEHYDEYYFPIKGECLPKCDPPKTPQIEIVDNKTWYFACLNLDQSVPDPDDSDEGGFHTSNPFYFPITAIRIASEKVAGVFIALDILISLLQDSHVMIVILVIKLLGFIKFMDIRVPPQVVQEFKTYDHNHFYLNFGPDMTEAVKDKFTKIPLPMVFERAGLHSSFLVNFFKPITSFLIMLGMMALIGILQRFFRKKAPHQYVLMKILLRRLEIFFRWNLVVLLVICNIDEVTLFGIIEWKTGVKTDSAQDKISLLLSLGMVIVSLFVFIAPFYLLHRVHQTRFKVLSNQANKPYFDLLKKIERFQLLWKDFKDSSWSERSFLPIYVLRIALVYLIIALLYKTPMLQAVLLLSQSVMMLTYMSIVKPFLKTLDFIKSIMYEVCMVIVIGSVFILAVLQRFHVEVKQLWLFLGDCIMFFNIWVCLTAVIFFGIKFFRGLQSLWKVYKSMHKPRVWLEFWILILQENDPVSEELRRNKKTSSKLDLTSLEKELQMKNLASYHISFTSSPHNPPESEKDDSWLSYIPRKSDMRIRRSLFSVRKRSSDSEGSPVKTVSTFDEDKSPSSSSTTSNENLILSNKRANIDRIKKNPQDISHLGSLAENDKPQLLVNGKGDLPSENNYSVRKNFQLKGLETIKEMDSMEVSRMRSDQQTKRLGNNNNPETLRGDLSFLSVVNKRLSSETVMQKGEEMEIIKEKMEMIKKKLTMKGDMTVQESLFQ